MTKVTITFELEVDEGYMKDYIEDNGCDPTSTAIDILIATAVNNWEYDKLITSVSIKHSCQRE